MKIRLSFTVVSALLRQRWGAAMKIRLSLTAVSRSLRQR
jgi:hypothetical protein